MKISGTIITLNAEKYILRAVKSLKLISDEVIVLDSDSTDSTRKIAESAGAKVYIQSFLGDGPQKKEASKYASNDWVFSLDADEYLDKDLIDYVNNIKHFDNKYDSFAFRRKNFCGDEWIKAAAFILIMSLDYMIRQKLTMIRELTMQLFKVKKRLE